LHNAAAKDRLELALVLIEWGANASALSERGGTPLHEAAASGSAEMVMFLLEQKVDPGIKANDGGPALDVAEKYKNEAAIELLK